MKPTRKLRERGGYRVAVNSHIHRRVGRSGPPERPEREEDRDAG